MGNKKGKINTGFVTKCIQVVSATFIYFALIWVVVNKTKFVVAENGTANVWDIIHQEIPNLLTIVSFAFPIVVSFIVKILDSNTTRMYRVIWGILLAILIICYRIFVDLGIHRVLFAFFGIGTYIFMLIMALFYTKPTENAIVASGKLLKAIGPIYNKKILSVQLFKCDKTVKDGFVNIQFRNVDSVLNQQNEDVNCILSIGMRLSEEDYGQFQTSLWLYDRIIENGDEKNKEKLNKSIEEAKESLIDQLNGIDAEAVTKEECCMARLLLCYSLLEKMLVEPAIASLDLEDGESGLDINIEKKLFSFFRTGMLGAYLFGREHRYCFRYRRDGMKIGRKYCAFLLGTPNIEDELLCLVTIKESNSANISGDIIGWIDRTEKKMINNISDIMKEKSSVL